MKVKIEIECDTVGEITSHLYEIIRQTKAIAKAEKLKHGDEFQKRTVFDDSNCYGDHVVKIIP